MSNITSKALTVIALASITKISESCHKNWMVDYVGESTQFRLMHKCQNETNTSSDDPWIKIKMSSLHEMKQNGKKEKSNAIDSFSKTDWKWDDPYCQGCKMVCIMYNCIYIN